MIKASYTADRQYYAQASRALYRRKNTAFAIFGLAGLLLCLCGMIIGSDFSAYFAAVALIFAAEATLPWWVPFCTQKIAKKSRADGARELYFSEEGLDMRSLKYGTETHYSPEQIGGAVRRGDAIFLLLGRKALMIRPEYFEPGGYEEFLQWLRRLNKTADIYDRKSAACFSYPAEKRARFARSFDLFPVSVAFFAAILVGVTGIFEGRKSAVFFHLPLEMLTAWMMLLTIVYTLCRFLRQCILSDREQSIHDRCMMQYKPILAFRKDKRLLTMALCRLSAGHSQYAEMALDKICPEKLGQKRRELYNQAKDMPESSRGRKLLLENLRLENRRELLFVLCCWIVSLTVYLFWLSAR